jgi:hypothetical protein
LKCIINPNRIQRRRILKDHRYLTIGLTILVLAGVFNIIPTVLKETILKWYPQERDELALRARALMKENAAVRSDPQLTAAQKLVSHNETRGKVLALVAQYSRRNAQVLFLDFTWDYCHPITYTLALIALFFLLAELVVSAIRQLPEEESGRQ